MTSHVEALLCCEEQPGILLWRIGPEAELCRKIRVVGRSAEGAARVAILVRRRHLRLIWRGYLGLHLGVDEPRQSLSQSEAYGKGGCLADVTSAGRASEGPKRKAARVGPVVRRARRRAEVNRLSGRAAGPGLSAEASLTETVELRRELELHLTRIQSSRWNEKRRRGPNELAREATPLQPARWVICAKRQAHFGWR